MTTNVRLYLIKNVTIKLMSIAFYEFIIILFFQYNIEQVAVLELYAYLFYRSYI